MSESKQEIREALWQALEDAGAARFPGTRGRIPNFTGAERAAERLAELEVFQRARALKANPDLPQRKVRHLALLQGKRVYMAVPKLAEEEPFLLLDPDELAEGDLWQASSIKGAFRLGRLVALEDVPELDLVVTGCVGATRQGVRLGKGGGYSDLEYGLLREVGKLSRDTPVVTTLHPSQLVEDGGLPRDDHDVVLDWVVTPEEALRCEADLPRPTGIHWGRLDKETIEAVPVLRARRGGG